MGKSKDEIQDLKEQLNNKDIVIKMLRDDYKSVLNANNNFAKTAKENSSKIAELESVLERKDNTIKELELKNSQYCEILKKKEIELWEIEYNYKELSTSNTAALDDARQKINNLDEKYRKLQDTLVFVIEQWKNSIS